MTVAPTNTDVQSEAARLRAALAAQLHVDGYLDDSAWRAAVETVPRHLFVPGFFVRNDDDNGPMWRPVTPATDPETWLRAVYSNETLITQFGGVEPDWDHPSSKTIGPPTSSSTLPSLVMRMWEDAEIEDDHQVLEIGTGTGYSTALACERLGSRSVMSVEIDPARLKHAHGALSACGYAPGLAVIDGLYGYQPYAPYDRIVAAASVRAIPRPWIEQTVPGGKILTTLGGWLHGYARVLLTVHADGGSAEGPLLAGTISFMPARAHAAPLVGNPTDWVAPDDPAMVTTRQVRFGSDLFTDSSTTHFHGAFLAQLSVPNAQVVYEGDRVRLVDVSTGSVAMVNDAEVQQWGPVRLWDLIEDTLTAWDDAGRPGPEHFRVEVTPARQTVTGAGLSLALPRSLPAL